MFKGSMLQTLFKIFVGVKSNRSFQQIGVLMILDILRSSLISKIINFGVEIPMLGGGGSFLGP